MAALTIGLFAFAGCVGFAFYAAPLFAASATAAVVVFATTVTFCSGVVPTSRAGSVAANNSTDVGFVRAASPPTPTAGPRDTPSPVSAERTPSVDEERTVCVSDGKREIDDDGERTLPADGERTLPADGERTLPADGERTLPADGERTLPADGERTLPADGGRTLPADGGRTLPVGGKSASLSPRTLLPRRAMRVYDEATTKKNHTLFAPVVHMFLRTCGDTPEIARLAVAVAEPACCETTVDAIKQTVIRYVNTLAQDEDTTAVLALACFLRAGVLVPKDEARAEGWETKLRKAGVLDPDENATDFAIRNGAALRRAEF
jgi:hypothetical protein